MLTRMTEQLVSAFEDTEYSSQRTVVGQPKCATGCEVSVRVVVRIRLGGWLSDEKVNGARRDVEW